MEIEAKIRVDRPSEIIGLLGEPSRTYLEVNYLLDDDHGGINAAGNTLRVRISWTKDGEVSKLTYKGKLVPGIYKSRPEIETDISNGNATLEILKSLGYIVAISYQKKRVSWQLERCVVELDELPLIGFFVEIEGQSDEDISAVVERLGLSGSPIIKDSYTDLLRAHLKSNNIPDTRIIFDESRNLDWPNS